MPLTFNLDEITLVKATELDEVLALGDGKVIFSVGDKLYRFDIDLITDQVAQISGGWQGNITPYEVVTEDGIYTPVIAGNYLGFGNLVYDPEGEDVGYLVQFVKDGNEYVKRKTKLALPDGFITGEVGSQVYPEITF